MEGIWKTLEARDMDLTLAINGFYSDLSDKVWLFFSDQKVWYVMYVIVAAAMIWRLGWKRGLVMIGCTALAVVAADQLTNVVKDWVQRLRPCNDPRMILRGLHILVNPSTRHPFGFFSAHAANAMVFAVCTAISFRIPSKLGKKKGKSLSDTYSIIYGIIIVLWALLVGISRVFVGKHFLGDVIVGFVAGLIISLIVCAIGRGICKLIKA